MQLIMIIVPYVKTIKITYFANNFEPQTTAVFIGAFFYEAFKQIVGVYFQRFTRVTHVQFLFFDQNLNLPGFGAMGNGIF